MEIVSASTLPGAVALAAIRERSTAAKGAISSKEIAETFFFAFMCFAGGRHATRVRIRQTLPAG